MKKILVVLLLSVSAQAANLDGFFAALAKVESSGNPKAVNKKETALGIYQIRPAYFKDARVKGNHEQVFNPVFARSVCEAYFKRYEPAAFAVILKRSPDATTAVAVGARTSPPPIRTGKKSKKPFDRREKPDNLFSVDR